MLDITDENVMTYGELVAELATARKELSNMRRELTLVLGMSKIYRDEIAYLKAKLNPYKETNA